MVRNKLLNQVCPLILDPEFLGSSSNLNFHFEVHNGCEYQLMRSDYVINTSGHLLILTYEGNQRGSISKLLMTLIYISVISYAALQSTLTIMLMHRIGKAISMWFQMPWHSKTWLNSQLTPDGLFEPPHNAFLWVVVSNKFLSTHPTQCVVFLVKMFLLITPEHETPDSGNWVFWAPTCTEAFTWLMRIKFLNCIELEMLWTGRNQSMSLNLNLDIAWCRMTWN